MAFVALAALSLAVSAAGHWFGQALSDGGHTSDARPHRIVIGANVVTAPANAIRFHSERRDGPAQSLHLYLRWPEMEGYSTATRDDFNHIGGQADIVFLTLQRQTMSRDMSGRFEPVYRSVARPQASPGPAELANHAFLPDSGYDNETLVVGPVETGGRFVARCLSGPLADRSLAGCERDILVGDELSLTYRFPERLLKDWRALDASVRNYAARLLDAGR